MKQIISLVAIVLLLSCNTRYPCQKATENMVSTKYIGKGGNGSSLKFYFIEGGKKLAVILHVDRGDSLGVRSDFQRVSVYRNNRLTELKKRSSKEGAVINMIQQSKLEATPGGEHMPPHKDDLVKLVKIIKSRAIAPKLKMVIDSKGNSNVVW